MNHARNKLTFQFFNVFFIVLAHIIHNAILTPTLLLQCRFIMKLEELEKKRDSYGGKIVKLALLIAVIFLVPVLVIAGISYYGDIKFMYLFPIAFVVSWVLVILLYRKVSKEVKGLDRQIKDLKLGQVTANGADVTATEHTSL